MSASPPWLRPSTWTLRWLQMATSSALSHEQQRAGRVTGWPLNPIKALPPLVSRQHNLTAFFWLLTVLLGEAVLLRPCSLVLPSPSLGSGPASYFLPWGTWAGHLEKQWSFPSGRLQGQVTQTFCIRWILETDGWREGHGMSKVTYPDHTLHCESMPALITLMDMP